MSSSTRSTRLNTRKTTVLLSSLLLSTSTTSLASAQPHASTSTFSDYTFNKRYPDHHDLAVRNSLGHQHHVQNRRTWEQRANNGARTERVPGFKRSAEYRHVSEGGISKRQDQTSPTPESFEFVGNSGVSAQMMYTTGGNKVYILDKTEDNPINVTSAAGVTHPAWGVEYDISDNTYRIMDVESNSFCAGGASLANGTWAVFGGNQPVTTGGVATTSVGAYDNTDGGTAIRLMTPCTDETCSYTQGSQPYSTANDTGGWLQMTGRRWYPTAETLADGSIIVIGGDKNGGYVNTALQDNPTYEFFPPRSTDPVSLQWLSDCLPVNLYPLTWLLPESGLLFMQANTSTIILDPDTNDVTYLPDMPHAVRVYPASAATAMLPLTPANNYTATILFCGGSNPPQWGDDGSPRYNVTAVQADATCVRISPEAETPAYTDDDSLDQGRSMGQFVYLPTGELFMSGGVAMGTAGYGTSGQYSIGQSFGQDPIYSPALYDPSAPAGSRWRFNLTATTQERMYHSTSLLLPDGSIMISGSNPNADMTLEQWPTVWTVERWYPSWYNEARPSNVGLPSTIAYGGQYWNFTINSTDETTIQTVKFVVLRQPFVTHVISTSYRYLELDTSYSIDMNAGTTTMFVSQLPPRPQVAAPGPAMMFVIIDGVPSVGVETMIGSGEIETQPTEATVALPSSVILAVTNASTTSTTSGNAATGTSGASTASSGEVSARVGAMGLALAGLLTVCTLVL